MDIQIIERIEQELNLERWYAKGGPGSGHWGHKGRKGKRGGSARGRAGGLKASNYDRDATEFYSSLTTRQAAALREYTQRATVNEYLKGGGRPRQDISVRNTDDQAYWEHVAETGRHPNPAWDPDHFERFVSDKELVKEIDSTMKPLPRDTVLHRRALGMESVEYQSGQLFTDNGFVSTSLSKEAVERFGTTDLELHVKGGTPHAILGGATEQFIDHSKHSWSEMQANPKLVKLDPPRYMGDKEVLLGRNCVYEFVGTKVVGDETRLVFNVGTPSQYGVPAGDLKKVNPRYDPKVYR